MPDVVKQHKPIQVINGFTLGLVLMLIIRKFAEAQENKNVTIAQNNLPMSLLVAIDVDIFIDGLLLVIGFTAGGTTGMLLAIALAIELLRLGMATATELGNKNVSIQKSIVLIISLAILFFISAIFRSNFIT